MTDARDDWLDITALINRYAQAVDGKDWALYASCFTTDAEIDYSSAGGARGGVAESTAWLATMLEPISVSQHYITNQVIEVRATRGRAGPISSGWWAIRAHPNRA